MPLSPFPLLLQPDRWPCPVGLLEDHPLWPPAPHSRFPYCFSYFSLVTVLHEKKSWSPTLRAMTFRGLNQARVARSTGKKITCCHRIGVRLNGKCLAWNAAERSAWRMLAVTLPHPSRFWSCHSPIHILSMWTCHLNLAVAPCSPQQHVAAAKATLALCPAWRYPRGEWAGVRQNSISLFPTLFLLALPPCSSSWLLFMFLALIDVLCPVMSHAGALASL